MLKCTTFPSTGFVYNSYQNPPYCYTIAATGSGFTSANFIAGEYIIELWGASGQNASYTYNNYIAHAGLGGYTKGKLKLKKPEIFAFFIGTTGSAAIESQNKPGTAGHNGGAPGLSDSVNGDAPNSGSGGATDMRIVTSSSSPSIYDRVMVAGGGGSGGAWFYSGYGGNGGGINGTEGQENVEGDVKVPPAKPGTQTTGYQIFQGQTGQQDNEPGGSGGGGYYGGYGGTCARSKGGIGSSGGGGGSSFISGHYGCIAMDSKGKPLPTSVHPSGIRFTDTETITGNNTIPSYSEMNKNVYKGNIGNGAVRITVLKFYLTIECSYSRCITRIPLYSLYTLILFDESML